MIHGWEWALISLPLLSNFVIGAFIANAAQRKGRSWAAFYWLSVLAGWLIMAIVVAAIAPVEGKAATSTSSGSVAAKIGGATVAIVGLLWLVVYYASEAQAPIMEFRNFNILIGLLLVIVGVVTAIGSSKKSSK